MFLALNTKPSKWLNKLLIFTCPQPTDVYTLYKINLLNTKLLTNHTGKEARTESKPDVMLETWMKPHLIHYHRHTMHVITHYAPMPLCKPWGCMLNREQNLIFLSVFSAKQEMLSAASVQHTWQSWSCQHATPSCQTELVGSVSPPGSYSRKAHHVQGLSSLAFTREKVNKMVEQINVTWLLCAFGRNFRWNKCTQHGSRIKYQTATPL